MESRTEGWAGEPLPADLPLLTESQRDLLAACVALGTADHVRLAAHLCVSPSTVLKTFARINKRLGTSSRADAILLAIREGIVSAPSPPAAEFDGISGPQSQKCL